MQISRPTRRNSLCSFVKDENLLSNPGILQDPTGTWEFEAGTLEFEANYRMVVRTMTDVNGYVSTRVTSERRLGRVMDLIKMKYEQPR